MANRKLKPVMACRLVKIILQIAHALTLGYIIDVLGHNMVQEVCPWCYRLEFQSGAREVWQLRSMGRILFFRLTMFGSFETKGGRQRAAEV